MTNPFVGLVAGRELELPANDQFSGAGHLWGQEEIDALILAHAASRPLLVRGEAGSGKSQIARAAAHVIRGELLVETIHARFEALDLLYRLDAIERLADAQAQQLDGTNKKYVKHGTLWEAFTKLAEGIRPVLLIDEIDKADADVPNALLGVLGNRSFTVPMLNNVIVKATNGHFPLIIVTTNEERELPAAFVRRCVVLNLNPPSTSSEFETWLVTRGNVHKHLTVSEDARVLAAAQVRADREAARAAGYPPVGLAEYIDLLTALHSLTQPGPSEQRAVRQMEWLQRLSAYALVKNATQNQRRTAVRPAPTEPAEPR